MFIKPGAAEFDLQIFILLLLIKQLERLTTIRF